MFCCTNHADADQNSNDDLLVMLAAAGCEYVMGVLQQLSHALGTPFALPAESTTA